MIDSDIQTVKAAISEIKDLYIVLDHSRTVMMTIQDGGLPSNVGGGGNVRNVLRRTFAIMQNRGWWNKLGIEGFLLLFKFHQKDLEGIFGEFPEYKSFEEIITVEYERYSATDDISKKNL